MAAYATHQRELLAREAQPTGARNRLRLARLASSDTTGDIARGVDLSVVDQLVDRLAQRVAALVTERLSATDDRANEWFDSRHAADYLGVHRDTLRKLASERAIPSEQDGPGCKLYFKRSDLDAWRRSGGRPRHVASLVGSVA
jgi:excisionase family DNA binding protein